MSSDPYDQVPYPASVIGETHPDRIATQAVLAGMEPPPVTDCRVLELGCNDGTNLLGMALSLPQSQFVGIDVNASAIAQAQARAEAYGLQNIAFHRLDILEAGPALGSFDYIVAHGVYSWVPDAVRERLLAIIGSNLTPNGIA